MHWEYGLSLCGWWVSLACMRRLGFIVCLLMMVVACSAPAPTVTQPSPLPLSPGAQYTTLIFWHAWPSPDQHILAKLVDRYNQSHPHTRIVPQAMPLASLVRELRTAALVGGGPHMVLLQSHTLGTLAQDGLVLPIDGYVSSAQRAQLLAPALQGAELADAAGETHLYGLPMTFDTLVFYYSKAHVTTPPTTTQELRQVAHRLTNTTTQPPVWGLAYTLSFDKTIGYLPAFDGAVFDSEGNLVLGEAGREGTERWLAWLLSLRHDQELLAINDSITVDSTLKAQKALMTIDWAHTLPTYHALWGDDLGVALLPGVADTGQRPRPYVQSTLISLCARANEPNEQEAGMDFMRYLVSQEAQHILLKAGKQPTLLPLDLEEESPMMHHATIFRAQAQQGIPMPNRSIDNVVVRDELERMQLTVLRGLTNPANAVTHAHTALRERLAPYGTFRHGGPDP